MECFEYLLHLGVFLVMHQTKSFSIFLIYIITSIFAESYIIFGVFDSHKTPSHLDQIMLNTI